MPIKRIAAIAVASYVGLASALERWGYFQSTYCSTLLVTDPSLAANVAECCRLLDLQVSIEDYAKISPPHESDVYLTFNSHNADFLQWAVKTIRTGAAVHYLQGDLYRSKCSLGALLTSRLPLKSKIALSLFIARQALKGDSSLHLVFGDNSLPTIGIDQRLVQKVNIPSDKSLERVLAARLGGYGLGDGRKALLLDHGEDIPGLKHTTTAYRQIITRCHQRGLEVYLKLHPTRPSQGCKELLSETKPLPDALPSELLMPAFNECYTLLGRVSGLDTSVKTFSFLEWTKWESEHYKWRYVQSFPSVNHKVEFL